MLRCLFVVLLLCCSLKAKAQLSDSLYKALPDTLRPKNKLALTDKERINIITNTSNIIQLHYHDDFKALCLQLQKDIDTVQNKIEKVPYANAIALFYIAVDERDNYFLWSKKLVEFGEGAQKYRSYICSAYGNMSLLYSGQGKQGPAIALLHKGLSIANQDPDAASLRPSLYYGYIQVYRQLALYHTSIDYVNKYLSAIPIKDRWNTDYTEVTLAKANAYVSLFRTEKKPVYADSARKLLRETMLVKKAESSYWYFICYFYLGLLDYYNQDYISAISYFDSALSPAYEKNQGYRFYIAQLYKNAALISLGRSEGVKPLLGLTIPAKDFNGRKEVNRVLYQYYSQHGDYQKALAHYTQYQAYSDSVDVIGQKGKIFEAEQKYSVAQKEVAIKDLENKNLQTEAIRNKIVVTAIIVVLLLAILALLLYLRNKRQQAQRLSERQKLTDELHLMEQEMEQERLNQQASQALAMNNQRKTISQNMHDEVSSSLVALRYRVADMKRTTPVEDTRQALDDIEDELNAVYLQTRDLLHRLADKTSQKSYNVFDLLENLSQRFSTGSGLQVHVEADRQLRDQLTPQQNAELYRVVKEAVANSMKHSGANRVDINLSSKEGAIVFSIQDNGRGVPVEKGNGLGLTAMQQRLENLHGRLWIEPTATGMGIRGSFPMGRA